MQGNFSHIFKFAQSQLLEHVYVINGFNQILL